MPKSIETWSKRFDDFCGDWNDEGDDFRETIAYSAIKQFIAEEIDSALQGQRKNIREAVDTLSRLYYCTQRELGYHDKNCEHLEELMTIREFLTNAQHTAPER